MEMSLLRLICDNKEYLRTLIEVLAKKGHFRHVNAGLLSLSFAKFSALLQAILDHKENRIASVGLLNGMVCKLLKSPFLPPEALCPAAA